MDVVSNFSFKGFIPLSFRATINLLMASEDSLDVTSHLLGLLKRANLPHLREEKRTEGRLFLAHSGLGCSLVRVGLAHCGQVMAGPSIHSHFVPCDLAALRFVRGRTKGGIGAQGRVGRDK